MTDVGVMPAIHRVPRPKPGEIISDHLAYDASGDDRTDFRDAGPDECTCAVGFLMIHLGLAERADLEMWWANSAKACKLVADLLRVNTQEVFALLQANDKGAPFHGVQRVSPQPLIAFVDAHPDLCWRDDAN
jgi:hypothetical protein